MLRWLAFSIFMHLFIVFFLFRISVVGNSNHWMVDAYAVVTWLLPFSACPADSMIVSKFNENKLNMPLSCKHLFPIVINQKWPYLVF